MKALLRWVKSLFPAPRTPFRWVQGVGITLAIVAYLLGIWSLERFHVMQIQAVIVSR